MQTTEVKIDPGEYSASRKRFQDCVDELTSLSVGLGGTASRDGRQYWASVLISKMALTCMTLDRIVPKVASRKSRELWDLSSIAALVRALTENYLLFFWLCVETEEKELWDFRITVLTIADNRARYRMTAEIEGAPEPEDFVAAQSALSDGLTGNRIFQQLGAGAQRDMLRGVKTPFIQDDLVERLDVDRATFRSFYRYLSSFVHTGTVSFFRMEKQRRGNGEFSDYEGASIRACLEFAILVVGATISDMKRVSRTASS